jgi:ComF family protein
MIQMVKADLRFSCLEAVIPVPLHPVKRRARGFNQSELLAQNLSQTMGWPLLRGALLRAVNTPSQSKLSLNERMTNVQDAFLVKDPREVKDKRILLVDDVLTTGSTADACSSVLLAAGAVQVSVVTTARAAEPQLS